MRSTNKQIPAKGPFPESKFYLAQINKSQGRIQDFKLGGSALKKIAPSGGRRENFGVFRMKNHDYTPKFFIFSTFRGCTPPWIRP
jgi:hypothetical protein